MKWFIYLCFLLPQVLLAQDMPAKHPRVIEVEEKLRDEASRYFTRRYPGEPFFVRADVNPLRRVTSTAQEPEGLPYFDAISEEDVDEWDDPTTPVSFLRNRVTKVTLSISIPDNFTEEKASTIRDELLVYLKLMPYRDEVRVERKLVAQKTPFLPPYFYPIFGGLLLAILILSLSMRWSVGSRKSEPAVQASAPAPAAAPVSMPRESSRGPSKTNAEVKGDVNFHDPLKLMDVVHFKMDHIRKSETFPTLKDMMTLHKLGEVSSEKLGALIQAMPAEWQKNLFSLGKGEVWLEAYAQPGGMDHEALMVLDRIARERHFLSGDRDKEDLLIQLWRMEDRSIPFLRKIDQAEAFAVLGMLPKSISLPVAKKAFPGGWARLLDNRINGMDAPLEKFRTWIKEAELLYPKAEWRTLESYKKDREILSYLDIVSIEEEKDIYESLSPDSFVYMVRPPLYKIFDLSANELEGFVARFSLDKWALVVLNSSRSYIRAITDVLDDKKKVLFSNHLRSLDSGNYQSEQIQWKKNIAEAAREAFPKEYEVHYPKASEVSEDPSAIKTA